MKTKKRHNPRTCDGETKNDSLDLVKLVKQVHEGKIVQKVLCTAEQDMVELPLANEMQKMREAVRPGEGSRKEAVNHCDELITSMNTLELNDGNRARGRSKSHVCARDLQN